MAPTALQVGCGAPMRGKDAGNAVKRKLELDCDVVLSLRLLSIVSNESFKLLLLLLLVLVLDCFDCCACLRTVRGAVDDRNVICCS